jgi:hypothetical protein
MRMGEAKRNRKISKNSEMDESKEENIEKY